MRKLVAIIMPLILAFSFAGCEESDKLVSGNEVKRPEVVDISEQNVIVTDFAVQLLQNTFSGEENVLLSPVSVLSGLSLIANGTDGESLAQIEEVVGMSAVELNEYIYSYNSHLSEISDKNCEASLVNSLWINKDKNVVVSEDFLYANEMYGNASIYEVSFGKKNARQMDEWISESTGEMFDDVLYDAPKDSTMCFISGFGFSGVWEDGFVKIESVSEDTNSVVSELYGKEPHYIEDNCASGFMKFFKYNKYALVVLLPNENIDINTYIDGLTSESIYHLIENRRGGRVDIRMPEISFSYELNMNHILTEMGMNDIWNSHTADFSRLGYTKNGENIQVDQLVYKTDIDLGVNGINTDLKAECLNKSTQASKYHLKIDRPFVVFLMDCENNVPLLAGVVMNAW